MKLFPHKYVINELKLPPPLIALIRERRWRRPKNCAVLAQITASPNSEDFVFLDITGMHRETKALRGIFRRGQGAVYGLASSKCLGRPVVEPELLDIDLSIVLAIDWAEHGICLDFRNEVPCVVAASDTRNGLIWKMAARNFDEFAEQLQL